MSKLRARTIGLLTLALSAVAAVTDVSADESRIAIRIYDTAAISAGQRAAAIRTAAAILDEAGLMVDWRDCSDRLAHRSCQEPRRARDLIVRIMPTSVSRTTSADAGFRLGVAVLDPGTRAGEMATIFHDRVQSVAHRTGVDCGQLLGRALAHEVGHLLLREMGHSRHGLMRAVWTDEELTSTRREDWLFAPSDLRQLQRARTPAVDFDLTQ
jgi:hypothetical protein